MVEIVCGNGRVALFAPYHPDCPKAAKKLGGKWVNVPLESGTQTRGWVFDVRDEERVRALARDLYGTDGTTPTETVTLRVEFSDDQKHYLPTNAALAGRVLARCYGRDSGAPVGDGVVILDGEFRSGGSRKNPNLIVEAGTVIEIRDVPKTKAEQEVTVKRDWVTCSICTV